MKSPTMVHERCHSCGGHLSELFSAVADPQTGETFGIARCDRCALGHTTPQPADLGRYYGAQYYGERHGFTKDWRMRRRWDLVTSIAARSHSGTAPRRLLDVGCGDGSFVKLAGSKGWTAVGIELGDNADRLRATGLDVRATLDLVKGEPAFDVITLWHSLEHMREPKATLAAVRKLLRDDGAVVIAVPDAGGLQAETFKNRWFHLDVPRHLFHFTRGALEQLLGASDLAPERWQHREVEQDVFGWLQSALNSVFPKPNVLFHALTGKPTGVGREAVLLSYAAGAALGPLTVPATAAGALLRRGATMTVVARPRR